MKLKDDVDDRSREYVCPVCKTKNIDLLPDSEPCPKSAKATKAAVVLSFGYQKDQGSASITVHQRKFWSVDKILPEPSPFPNAPNRATMPEPIFAANVAEPQLPSPWVDCALVVCIALLVALILRKFLWQIRRNWGVFHVVNQDIPSISIPSVKSTWSREYWSNHTVSNFHSWRTLIVCRVEWTQMTLQRKQ